MVENITNTEKALAEDKLRNSRKKLTAEVFTPDDLVKEMLDKLPEKVWVEDETFLDPSCGNGNFLAHVLYRKLEKGHNSVGALKSIFGLDIERGNIYECRLILLKIVGKKEELTEEHLKAVTINIKHLNSKKWPNGSLDYDMKFKNNANLQTIREWLENIKENGLDHVEIPFNVASEETSPSLENGKISTRYTDSVDLFEAE
jgi:SAM-dependent methyltransferase